MGIIDIVLLIIIGVFAVKGLIKGLVMEIFGLLALVAGYIAAYKYSHLFSRPVEALGLDEKSASAIGYVVGFLIAYIIVVALGSILSRAFKEVKLSSVNRGGGFFFGGIKAAVILGLILSAVITVAPKDADFTKNLQSGAVSGRLAKISPFIYRIMNKVPDVKKLNPFDIPEVQKTKDVIDELEDQSLQDALDSLKEADQTTRDITEGIKEGAEKTVDDITKEKPLENPLDGLQKDN